MPHRGRWLARRSSRHSIHKDGTRKWLLRFGDGQEVSECVFIPEEDRGARCIVSTGVGCTLTCKFCHTGTMPLVRNLGPAEVWHR
ncbi:MAG: hypothetical protein R3D03_08160 [Geminicoccaceae bacterium]